MPLDRNSIAGLAQAPRKLPSSVPAMFAFAARTSPENSRAAATCRSPSVLRLWWRSAATRCALSLRPRGLRDRRCPHAVRRLRRRGLAAVWHSSGVDKRRDARGELRRRASHIAERRHRPHANHARDVGCLDQRYRLGRNPYDAHDNIIAGAAYLRELHDRYGIPGFLAAYNAGPARWEDHLATGRPLPAETRAYLSRLAPIVGGSATDDTLILAAVVKSWTEASLFPSRSSSPPSDTPSAPTPQSSRPSMERSAQDWTALAPQSDGLFVALSSRERPQ